MSNPVRWWRRRRRHSAALAVRAARRPEDAAWAGGRVREASHAQALYRIRNGLPLDVPLVAPTPAGAR